MLIASVLEAIYHRFDLYDDDDAIIIALPQLFSIVARPNSKMAWRREEWLFSPTC